MLNNTQMKKGETPQSTTPRPTILFQIEPPSPPHLMTRISDWWLTCCKCYFADLTFWIFAHYTFRSFADFTYIYIFLSPKIFRIEELLFYAEIFMITVNSVRHTPYFFQDFLLKIFLKEVFHLLVSGYILN